MAPPLGFVVINEAVAMLTAARPEQEDGAKLLAEACEAGKVIAAYRSVTGHAEDLERRVWQMPHWRNYFDTGVIELTLPLVDEHLRPVSDGRTARCPREIFIRRDSLAAFIAEIPVSASDVPHQPKRGPKAKTLERVVAAMRLHLREGKISGDGLRGQLEKDLAAEYGASRDTVRKARSEVLATVIMSKPSKKLSSNDK
jgi:hypothetical protein